MCHSCQEVNRNLGKSRQRGPPVPVLASCTSPPTLASPYVEWILLSGTCQDLSVAEKKKIRK